MLRLASIRQGAHVSIRPGKPLSKDWKDLLMVGWKPCPAAPARTKTVLKQILHVVLLPRNTVGLAD